MKIMNPLEKGYNKVVKVLTKIYGVEADIYFPLEVNNLKHGFRDDDITYNNEEPDLSRKILIPALFRAKQDTAIIIDDYDNEGTWLYVPNNTEIPELSKIVLRYKNAKIRNFQVLRYKSAEDDVQTIYGKYELVPLGKIDIEVNREETEDLIEEYLDEVDEAEFTQLKDDLLNLDERDSVEEDLEKSVPSIPATRKYSPIGD